MDNEDFLFDDEDDQKRLDYHKQEQFNKVIFIFFLFLQYYTLCFRVAIGMSC